MTAAADEEFSNTLSEISGKLSELDKLTRAAMSRVEQEARAETGRNSYVPTYQWQLLHAILQANRVVIILAHPLPAAIQRETGPGGGT